nr:hypothetical protein [Lachnospiraceae bacterium]
MCGIVGKFDLENQAGCLGIESITDLGKAMDVQVHRGPDDCGVCGIFGDRVFEGIKAEDLCKAGRTFDGLVGFNRLSIRDLSSSGHQPMLSDDKKIILLFNGEIYNDIQLRETYLQDVSFRGHSDTETILRLYEKQGFEPMVKLLNGMFSIALIDLRLRKLFIARDRFGIKPFYISYQNGSVFFASEIKSLIQFRDFKSELDEDSF